MSHRPTDTEALRIRLLELFRYDEAAGDLIRIKAVRHRYKVGDIAGSIGSDGYVLLSVDYRNYRAHSLIWLMKTGEWPADTVDHRDGIRSNNRWLNLRAATKRQNNQNSTRARRTSRSGLLGAKLLRDKFQSSLSGRHLGTFTTAQQAHEAYMEAKREREELASS